jgi:hypothetical protein
MTHGVPRCSLSHEHATSCARASQCSGPNTARDRATWPSFDVPCPTCTHKVIARQLGPGTGRARGTRSLRFPAVAPARPKLVCVPGVFLEFFPWNFLESVSRVDLFSRPVVMPLGLHTRRGKNGKLVHTDRQRTGERLFAPPKHSP